MTHQLSLPKRVIRRCNSAVLVGLLSVAAGLATGRLAGEFISLGASLFLVVDASPWEQKFLRKRRYMEGHMKVAEIFSRGGCGGRGPGGGYGRGYGSFERHSVYGNSYGSYSGGHHGDRYESHNGGGLLGIFGD